MWPFRKAEPLSEAHLAAIRDFRKEWAEARAAGVREFSACAGGGAHNYVQRLSLSGFLFGEGDMVCSKCGEVT